MATEVNLIGHLREFNPQVNEWTIFKPRLENYFQANTISTEEKKRAILLNILNEEAYKLVFSLCVPELPETKTYNALIGLLDEHYKSQIPVFANRIKFYQAVKSQTESVQEWAARVRSLAAFCEFSGTEIEMVLRDKFIIGFNKGAVQDRLLEEKKAVTFARVVSIASAKMAVHSEGSAKVKIECDLNHFKAHGFQAEHASTSGRKVAASRATSVKCTVCGRKNHLAEKCFFKNSVCHTCNKKGHLAPVCTFKNKSYTAQNKINYKNHKNLNFIETNTDEMFAIESQIVGKYIKPIEIEVLVENIKMNFQIDTGSGISVISERLWFDRFKNFTILPTNKEIFFYNGDKIIPIGYCKLNILYQNNLNCIDIYIIKNGGPPILGRDFLKMYNLGLSQLNHIEMPTDLEYLVKKYNNVFSPGLGKFNKSLATINLKEGTVPKFFRARPLPYALQNKIENELNRLADANIIIPVDYSDWATPIVPVLKKDGSVRICGDFKVTLNPHLHIDKFPLPKIEDLFQKLEGGVHFTKLDLSQAYQQVCLDEKSQELVTISTHKGLFKYTRLPFGVSCAPGKFQKIMESILQGIDGVVVFLDDILICGKNRKQHIERLETVLQKLANCGLKLLCDKCSFFKSKIEYLGYVIDAEGLHTSDSKIMAIKNAPIPKSVTQLKSILGLINYYGKFIKNLSTVLHPLYKLLKVNVKWNWSIECDSAFNKIKKLLMSSKVLVHYNAEREIRLTTDASDYGIGAVISHIMPDKSEKPIAYASRTLSAAEKKYSQIEKEGLSIIYGLSKFFQYLYGREFVLVTDHKPLVAIFNPNKGIPQFSANRLRRWAVILSNYRYKIIYIKSSENKADFLSRLPLENKEVYGENIDVNYINYFTNNVDFPINHNKIVDATGEDKILSKIINFVTKGWPYNANSNIELSKYYPHRNEFSIENKCLIWNNRLVVPLKLRNFILSELHRSHMGVVKMKSLARSYVWWPSLNNDIENIAKKCESCLIYKNSPPKVPLQLWKWPEKPWSRIHIDYMGPFLDKYFLIILDAHSKWIEVFQMNSITSKVTINALRSTFARYGLPNLVVSDNGTQFVSRETEFFLKTHAIEHITSPPFNPSSNGAAENSVKTIKNALRNALGRDKSIDINVVLCNFLFDYRNTPHTTTGVTPSFLLMGRNARTRFDLLRKEINTNSNSLNHTNKLIIKNRVKHNQNNQRNYFKGSRNVEFNVGEEVTTKDYRVINKTSWIKGIITKRIGKVTYLIKIPETDKIWKRHSNQILKTISSKLPNSGIDQISNNSRELQICTDQNVNYDDIIGADFVNDIVKEKESSRILVKSKRNIKPPDRLTYDFFK